MVHRRQGLSLGCKGSAPGYTEGVIEDRELLTEAECETVAEEVFALRELWVHRNPEGPFYTLGAASYLDAAGEQGNAPYYAKAARYNPVLLEHFGWLYERLGEALAQALSAPVEYDTRSARPGFHVFLAAKVFERPVASIHVDKQYELVDWSGADEPDFGHPLSFTVGIVLPRSGTGLNYWDLPYEALEGMTRAQVEEYARTQPCRSRPYRLGHLVMHSGHMVHQIAPSAHLEPDDPRDARITLQGHGIRCGGTWRIYW